MISISEHTIKDENLKDLVIVDFGACEGKFLRGCLEKFDVKKYIAVEANHKLYEDLQPLANKMVSIHHGAVSAHTENDKIITFYVDPESIFNSSLIWSNPNWIPQEVKTISLQAIIDQYQLTKIDIFKVDVEGAEWDILEEFDNKLYDMIDQITVEFHDFIKPEYRKRTKEIVVKLKGLGYRHNYKGIKYMHNSIYYDSLFYKSDEKVSLIKQFSQKFKPVKYY